jgi:hypothetical protein
MTISTSTGRIQYTGNAATTAFATNFKLLDSSHVRVLLDGTLKTETTHYTVSGVGNSTATVTFLTAPGSGVVVTLTLSVPITQTADFVNGQAFNADAVEEALDLGIQIDQATSQTLSRALLVPETVSTSFDGEIPSLTANYILTVNDDATGFLAVDPSTMDLQIGSNTGDQDVFKTISVSGQSDVVADNGADTLTLAAGSNITITTDAATDTITIASSGGGGNSFSTIAVSGQSDVVADSSTDTLTLAAGTGIAITTNAGTDTITISGNNAFSTIAVSGQSDVVADATSDTLTLVAGSGMTITTNAATDTITLASSSSVGSKQIQQVVTASSTTSASTSTTIPGDTTIPQNTEGAELVTLAITPSASGSTLVIDFFCPIVGNSASNLNTFALFQDTTANALNAGVVVSDSTARGAPFAMRHVMTAGTTSSTTFKIRFGPAAGTTHVLRSNDGALTLGAVPRYTFTITEILA